MKCDSEYFKGIRAGAVQFTVRKNDRVFRLGDTVMFQEWDGKKTTGENHESGIITSITTGGKYGIEENYVVLGWELSKAPLVTMVDNVD